MTYITKQPFDGQLVKAHCYTLENEFLKVNVLDYGAALQAIFMKESQNKDVILGFDTLDEYIADKNNAYHGATIGRCANRIAYGTFELEGQEYHLACNCPPHHLHGGINGFNSKLFDAKIEQDHLVLTVRSEDMEEGYPHALELTVTYRLSGRNLIIEYQAQSDGDTFCNITNHAYFNLSDEMTVDHHELMMEADFYARSDEHGLAGEICPVDQSAFDFRESRILADQMAFYQQDGYDHHFILNENGKVILKDPVSKRKMTLTTTQNGVQIYTANGFDHNSGKQNQRYEKRAGIAIEAQQIPDAIHREGYSAVLKKDEIYYQKTVLCFEIDHDLESKGELYEIATN